MKSIVALIFLLSSVSVFSNDTQVEDASSSATNPVKKNTYTTEEKYMLAAWVGGVTIVTIEASAHDPNKFGDLLRGSSLFLCAEGCGSLIEPAITMPIFIAAGNYYKHIDIEDPDYDKNDTRKATATGIVVLVSSALLFDRWLNHSSIDIDVSFLPSTDKHEILISYQY